MNQEITRAEVTLKGKGAIITMQRHLCLDELQETIGRDTKYKISKDVSDRSYHPMAKDVISSLVVNKFIVPMQIFGLFILILLVSNAAAQVPVNVAGEMSRIMQQGNLSPVISLDTLATNSHIYGLGAVGWLKGEIIILDGKTYVSGIQNKKVVTTQTKDVTAAMLVYAEVKHWEVFEIPDTIRDLGALENSIESIAKQNGFDINLPFPFLIKSTNGKTNYHIIDWQPNVEHTISNHKQFAKSGQLENEDVVILGFYSSKHHGIFTHHSSNIHVHITNRDRSIVGHVDSLELKQGYELSLAKSYTSN